MSVIPEVIGGISAAAKFFSICVAGFEIISSASDSSAHMLSFKIQLDIEIKNLVLWGRNSGLSRGQLDHSLEPVKQLLVAVLGAIATNLKSTESLKEAYGIELAQDRASATTNIKKSDKAKALRDLNILLLPGIESEISKQEATVAGLGDTTSIYRKLKWAVWDEKRATRFVEAVRGYVTSLNNLLTASQKAARDAEDDALRIVLLGRNWAKPVESFRALENATSGKYESIALPARLARLKLEFEMEELAPLPSEPGPLPARPLPVTYEQITPIDADHSIAGFHNEKLLIEWRTLKPSEAQGERARLRTKQTAMLAGIFKELKAQPTIYRVLACEGYIDQRDHIPPRLGIAFIMPSLAPSLPDKNVKIRQYYSLHDYLTSRDFEDFEPPLESRFKLARELVQGFLQFHRLGWLHKSIRSHNIIFFPPDGKPSIASPRILGFAYSRPTEVGISDPVEQDEELELYRHPEYQGRSPESFRLRYDFFSIGMLLYEVARWRPIMNSYFRYKGKDPIVTPATFAKTLVENERRDLGFRMGTHYADATLTCLEGSFGDEVADSDEVELKLSYFNKVVKALDICKA